ncbi:hypothetical protein KK060_21035 [Fulvivirgaceae bacterium PWU20]|uniref:Uncharacterized protein n=1 Tax=Chryseosolibacter indicus TaxID=2782351 RepID=A0ABS5VWJ4_9BACT|nr:hypothetical protein [Chryseosolibacter indicus]
MRKHWKDSTINYTILSVVSLIILVSFVVTAVTNPLKIKQYFTNSR